MTVIAFPGEHRRVGQSDLAYPPASLSEGIRALTDAALATLNGAPMPHAAVDPTIAGWTAAETVTAADVQQERRTITAIARVYPVTARIIGRMISQEVLDRAVNAYWRNR